MGRRRVWGPAGGGAWADSASLVAGRAGPTSVKFREAYARGVPLIFYGRYGPGASAYRAAAEAFLQGSRAGMNGNVVDGASGGGGQ